MNRSTLVELMASRFSHLTKSDAELAVRTILDAMTDAMVSEQRIEIRDFGNFTVVHRAPRIGRNPRSGDPVEIPQKRLIHFKPGKALRESVDAHRDEESMTALTNVADGEQVTMQQFAA